MLLKILTNPFDCKIVTSFFDEEKTHQTPLKTDSVHWVFLWLLVFIASTPLPNPAQGRW
jgi:hypothetical protein